MTTSVPDLSWSCSIRIPAKAMLFGEYGVLHGGPALVATLAQPFFEMEADLAPARESGVAAGFCSDFFQHPLTFDVRATQISGDSGAAAEFIQRCFAALGEPLSALSEAGLALRIKVTKSFPSELGLGSSSAIIVGLVWLSNWAHCLAVAVAKTPKFLNDSHGVPLPSPNRNFADAWPELQRCLAAAQGKGSGYDLAVQYAALERAQKGRQPSTGLWCFQPLAGKGDAVFGGIAMKTIPKVELLQNERFWNRAGFLLPSGAAAATGAILHKLSADSGAAHFAQQHADLAREAIKRVRDEKLWLEDTGSHPFADLLSSALAIAQQQGIAGHVAGMAALALLPPGTVYKTMGAGFGDCIWCVSSQVGDCVPTPHSRQETSDHESQGVMPQEAIPLFAKGLSL